jgi:hypothetical protein
MPEDDFASLLASDLKSGKITYDLSQKVNLISFTNHQDNFARSPQATIPSDFGSQKQSVSEKQPRRRKNADPRQPDAPGWSHFPAPDFLNGGRPPKAD